MEKLSDLAPNTTVLITGLSSEGRGIAQWDGKIMFVDNALPGETVVIHTFKKHRQYNEAKAIEILTRSPDRVQPLCTHYDICGGCSLQHLSADAQLRHKEQTLLEQLDHLAGIQPKTLLPP